MTNQKRTISLVKILLVVLVLVLALPALAVWNAPPANPPDCPASNPGCLPPLNVGSSMQTKPGLLNLGYLGLNALNNPFSSLGITSDGKYLGELVKNWLIPSKDFLHIFGQISNDTTKRKVKVWDNLEVVNDLTVVGTTTTTNLRVLNQAFLPANNTYICTTAGACTLVNTTTSTTTGASLPVGSSGQTLRHSGTNWVSDSFVTNNSASPLKNLMIGTKKTLYENFTIFDDGIAILNALSANNATINNKLTITNGAGDGKVLTSDAVGRASWQTLPTGSAGLPSGSSGQTLRHDGNNWVSDSFVTNKTGGTLGRVFSVDNKFFVLGGGITVLSDLFAQTAEFIGNVIVGGNLETGGKISASGDICTKIGGTEKCLSNIASSVLPGGTTEGQTLAYSMTSKKWEPNSFLRFIKDSVNDRVVIGSDNRSGVSSADKNFVFYRVDFSSGPTTYLSGPIGNFRQLIYVDGITLTSLGRIIDQKNSILNNNINNELAIVGGSNLDGDLVIGNRKVKIYDNLEVTGKIIAPDICTTDSSKCFSTFTGGANLPTGTSNQTLRNDNGTWKANDFLKIAATGLVSLTNGLDVTGNTVLRNNTTINGKLTIADGTAGADKVLTSNANGQASWKTLSELPGITQVVANPGGTGTPLTTIGIGNNTYSISPGVSLPTGTSNQTLRNDNGTWKANDFLKIAATGLVSLTNGLDVTGNTVIRGKLNIDGTVGHENLTVKGLAFFEDGVRTLGIQAANASFTNTFKLKSIGGRFPLLSIGGPNDTMFDSPLGIQTDGTVGRITSVSNKKHLDNMIYSCSFSNCTSSGCTVSSGSCPTPIYNASTDRLVMTCGLDGYKYDDHMAIAGGGRCSSGSRLEENSLNGNISNSWAVNCKGTVQFANITCVR